MDQKQLFTILPSYPCPKSFGIPKMKLIIQNINWELMSFGHIDHHTVILEYFNLKE